MFGTAAEENRPDELSKVKIGSGICETAGGIQNICFMKHLNQMKQLKWPQLITAAIKRVTRQLLNILRAQVLILQNTETSVPVKIPHHEVLELGGNAPVEAGPGQQPVRLPVRHPVGLMARLPLEVGVTQGHADVVQEAGQRTQFDNGVLRLGRQAEPFLLCFCVVKKPPPPHLCFCCRADVRATSRDESQPHLDKCLRRGNIETAPRLNCTNLHLIPLSIFVFSPNLDSSFVCHT